MTPGPTPVKPTVLIVEDEPAVARMLARGLGRAHVRSLQASSAAEARTTLGQEDVDVVLTDLDLGGPGGLEVVAASRELRPHAAVVILTGKPTLDSAIEAMRLGANRYLRKPVPMAELRQVVGELRELSLRARGAASVTPPFSAVAAGRLAYDAAVASLHLVWQPIVNLSTRAVVACEALVRTAVPDFTPTNLFSAAEALGTVGELTHQIHTLAARALDHNPRAYAFVNVHATELVGDDLVDSGSGIVRHAERITLELTERSSLGDAGLARGRAQRLREAGYGIALDDLGAGYSGLTTFAAVRPDIAKIDRSLITGAEADPVRRHMVSSLARMCAELGVGVVAEGIETASDWDAAHAAGCLLAQGFGVALPSRDGLDQDWSHAGFLVR